MPIKIIVILLSLLSLFLPSATGICQESATRERASRILAELDDLWRSESSHSLLTIPIQTQHYTRTMTMEAWTKGKEKSLIRIIAPQKERGTATLKSDNSIYTYLPKTDRTIRLTASMMMSSWMGSHFTNDDLIKESRLSEDYVPDITFEGQRQGQQVLEFTLAPKPEAPVVWGRLVITVLAENYLPVQTLYYDEDMVLIRTIRYDRIEELGGRLLPSRLRVVPADEDNEFTELLYQQIDFGIQLPESFFSLQQLRRK